MGRENNNRQAVDVPGRSVFVVLLALHSTVFVLLLHYSRVSPVVDGRRYFPSTAVFLTEVTKLAVCLTVALYDVSKSAPPSMPATSLFTSLSAAIFSGDSWKLVVPAGLYTLANSLLYIGLSNLQAATFQVAYQLRIVAAAAFGAVVFKRNYTLATWMSLLAILVGVAIVQFPASDPYDVDSREHLHVPRTIEAWKSRLHKRSATYEGIEEDLMLGHTQMDGRIGLLATVAACVASGLAGVTFEKVLKNSSSPTTIWIRNVQLAVYSIFPALFIGVVFLDGEKIAKVGFFDGYDWTVWATIAVHAIGGIATSFCISYAENMLRYSAGGISIVLSTIASFWLFEFKLSASFVLGTAIIQAATYVYTQNTPRLDSHSRQRAAPIPVQGWEKSGLFPNTDYSQTDVLSLPNDFSVRLPTTPLLSEHALSTSRPGSPGFHRGGPNRTNASKET